MLQGVNLILREAVGRGNLRAIDVGEAILLIEHSRERDIATALLATKSVITMREALRLFTQRFCEHFGPVLWNSANVSQFASTSDLVEECFPFIPE
jgi:hypothetical protein